MGGLGSYGVPLGGIGRHVGSLSEAFWHHFAHVFPRRFLRELLGPVWWRWGIIFGPFLIPFWRCLHPQSDQSDLPSFFFKKTPRIDVGAEDPPFDPKISKNGAQSAPKATQNGDKIGPLGPMWDLFGTFGPLWNALGDVGNV